MPHSTNRHIISHVAFAPTFLRLVAECVSLLADESSGDTPSFNFSTQKYEEVRELGRGTYSRALLLRSLTTGKFAVSKQIWVAGLASDRTELKRIAREVNILASLDHQARTPLGRHRPCPLPQGELQHPASQDPAPLG